MLIPVAMPVDSAVDPICMVRPGSRSLCSYFMKRATDGRNQATHWCHCGRFQTSGCFSGRTLESVTIDKCITGFNGDFRILAHAYLKLL